MNRKTFFFALLCLAVPACGSELQPDYTTIHGIIVLENPTDLPVDREDIEIGTDIVIDDIVSRHLEDFNREDVLNLLKNADVRIEFVRGQIEGASETCLGRTYAQTDGGAYVRIRDVSTFDGQLASSVAETGLSHELIHVIQNLYDIRDYDHNDQDFFQNENRSPQENSGTIEAEIHNDYLTALCPKYCEF